MRDHLSKSCFILLTCFLFLLSASSFAQTNVNAESILQNVASQVPSIMRMVTAIAYVMGMYFMILGILKFKQYGESRTMMSHDRSMMSALVYLFVGAFLTFIPSTVQTLLYTFWNDPNPYGYLHEQGQYQQFITDAFVVVQLFGTIAVIRGLVLLSHLGGQGGHQDSLAKGLTHLIGGIFCINIYQFVKLIFFTLGIPEHSIQ